MTVSPSAKLDGWSLAQRVFGCLQVLEQELHPMHRVRALWIPVLLASQVSLSSWVNAQTIQVTKSGIGPPRRDFQVHRGASTTK